MFHKKEEFQYRQKGGKIHLFILYWPVCAFVEIFLVALSPLTAQM